MKETSVSHLNHFLALVIKPLLNDTKSNLCCVFVQDYILLVPEGAFSDELQEDAPVPLTHEFLDSCSKDHFAIKSSDPQFCKDSVFSLTASFNNGSFACDCNPKGSYDSDCQEFGGQCSCRPNVIGRTCSRCKTGYYGFPNCRSKWI